MTPHMPSFALSAAFLGMVLALATVKQPAVSINIHPTAEAIATIGTHQGSDQSKHPAPEAGTGTGTEAQREAQAEAEAGPGVVSVFVPVQPNRRHEARTKLPANNVSEVTSYE